jgi:hypothetical protein
MEAFDRAIEVGSSWRDGGVVSAEGLFDHAGEEAIVAGGDGADEFSSVIGLDGDLREIESGSTEVIEAEGDESGGVEGGELVGITDEGSGGEDIFDGVFELREHALSYLGVERGDVVQVLDIDLPVR